MRRTILKVKGKLPDFERSCIKEMEGYWDYLFDAWSIPAEKKGHLSEMLKINSIVHEIREFDLPENHVHESKQQRFLSMQYTQKLEIISKLERELTRDIEIFERQLKRIPMPYSYSMYLEVPSPKEINPFMHTCELALHKRALEVQSLRSKLYE